MCCDQCFTFGPITDEQIFEDPNYRKTAKQAADGLILFGNETLTVAQRVRATRKRRRDRQLRWKERRGEGISGRRLRMERMDQREGRDIKIGKRVHSVILDV